jgi:hypothetical protein
MNFIIFTSSFIINFQLEYYNLSALLFPIKNILISINQFFFAIIGILLLRLQLNSRY